MFERVDTLDMVLYVKTFFSPSCQQIWNKTIGSGLTELGISDHSLVYISRKIDIPKEGPKII